MHGSFHGRSLALLLLLTGIFTGFYVTGDLIGAKLFTFTVFGLGPKHLGLGDGGDFVMTAGTAACSMGNARAFRKAGARVRVTLVEPESAPHLSKGRRN